MGGRIQKLRHGSLFSGIGGFDLAAEWCGWQNIFHCEINEFCNRILNYYWPKAASIKNIIDYEWEKWKGKIDVLSGGFPCQPYSVAGKRLGKADPRHLWPYMLRAIQAIRPTWVVGENVRGLISWNEGMVFDEVQSDLESAGYEIVPFLLPAAGINAPHRRDRIWFVAYSNGHDGISKKRRGYEETESLAGAFRSKDGTTEQSCGADRDDLSGLWSQQYDPTDSYNWQQPQQQTGYSANECNAQEAWSGNRADTSSGDQLGDLAERVRHMGASPPILHDTAANAYSDKRSKGGRNKERSEKTKRIIGKCHAWFTRTNWKNFPSQSPLCNGDDGLSGLLDAITFSKWRTESLKAGGNAIVPHIAFQIFQSINRFTGKVSIR